MSRTLRILSSLLYLISLIFHIVDSKCVTSFCRNQSLPIHYPFALQGGRQKGCDVPPINLTCAGNQTSPVLNLPSFGDFYVRNISYTAKTIQLYDPKNCLGGRFVDSNFPSSSLVGLNYQNYTVFTCPGGFSNTNGMNFTAISCLSNSSYSVYATASVPRAQELSKSGCNMSVTVSIPVSSSLQFEYNGFSDDLVLTWNIPYCDVCTKKKRLNAGVVFGLVILSIVWPFVSIIAIYLLFKVLVKLGKFLIFLIVLVVMMISELFLVLKRLFTPRTRNTPSAQNDTNNNNDNDNNNNDDDDVSSVTRSIILGESRRIPGPNGTACPICLEDFKPKDTLRSISQCEHCFHADCIVPWLRTHHSCPVCRNTTP